MLFRSLRSLVGMTAENIPIRRCPSCYPASPASSFHGSSSTVHLDQQSFVQGGHGLPSITDENVDASSDAQSFTTARTETYYSRSSLGDTESSGPTAQQIGCVALSVDASQDDPEAEAPQPGRTLAMEDTMR